jgi:predicted RNase H-like nuclease (RuvC/YqgF family)
MKLPYLLLSLLVASLAGAGCVSVKTPEKIEIGTSAPEPVDSSRLPQTASHEECRQELYKAYQNIQYLERENQRLKEKADKYKRERDECRKRLDKFEKD